MDIGNVPILSSIYCTVLVLRTLILSSIYVYFVHLLLSELTGNRCRASRYSDISDPPSPQLAGHMAGTSWGEVWGNRGGR